MTAKHLAHELWAVNDDASGTTAIEYAMIALFIGLVLISLQGSIGASVQQFFMDMANGL